jgi:hypothetical protein
MLPAGYQPPVGHTVASQLVGDLYPRHEPQLPQQHSKVPVTGFVAFLFGRRTHAGLLILRFASLDGGRAVLSSRNRPDWRCQSLA